jgi:transposase
MDLAPELRDLIIRTAQDLPVGARRRRYVADTITTLRLGQRQAQQLFGWGRDTIRKALHECRCGITCQDAFRCRGRKPAEQHLPNLLEDIKAIVHDHLQTDPTFASTRLYCRLTAAEVRRQLLNRKGYADGDLPGVKTITDKLNALGFRLRKVAKCRPKKK